MKITKKRTHRDKTQTENQTRTVSYLETAKRKVSRLVIPIFTQYCFRKQMLKFWIKVSPAQTR